MQIAQSLSSSSLSLPPDSYIYHLKSLSASTIVASCSDNSLRIFDTNLSLQSSIKTSHARLLSLTTLTSASLAVTGGEDGVFNGWDVRASTSRPVFTCNNESLGPISALALPPFSTSSGGDLLAVGTEETNHQAVVTIWDTRSLGSSGNGVSGPLQRYNESHNDDVTELQWSSSGIADGSQQPRYLLSGSTDMLVNIYDLTQSDPDDALVKILNARSSVSHAGFFDASGIGNESSDGADKEHIYSVSHDEKLTTWALPVRNKESGQPRYVDAEDEDVDDAATEHGDVRPLLDCGYVIGVIPYSADSPKVLGVGHINEKRVDLLPFAPGVRLEDAAKQAIRLSGAHGEEVVRSFCVDSATDIIYTGGEDGMVRAWRGQGTEAPPNESSSITGSTSGGPVRGKTRKENKLFRPY